MSDDDPTAEELGYAALAQHVDQDELHDQIARQGLSVLERSIPYVVRAARWRRIDAARRTSRQRPLADDDVAPGALMDPFEAAVASEQRHALADALASLSDPDVVAVWHHVEGMPDQDIAQAIIDAGGPTLTPAAVRKRRERALGQLRNLFHLK